MGTIREQNGKFRYRIRKRNFKGQQIEKSICLDTDKLETAKIRATEISTFENEIIEGREIIFSWSENLDFPTPRYKLYTIEGLITKYITFKKLDKINPIRLSTVRLYDGHLKKFSTFYSNKNINRIDKKKVEKYIESLISKKMSNVTININIRTLNTFFKWCYDKKYMKVEIKMKQLKIRNNLPKHVSDSDYEKIMGCVSKPELIHVYNLYRNTGIRKSEILGDLDGNFLIVKQELSKTGVVREILLSDDEVKVVKKFQKSGMSPTRLSVLFSQASREAGIPSKLHSLRHTFANRFYLKTGDIYKVKILLGHASIKTTEIYTHTSIRRLKQDFPSLMEESSK